MTQEKFCSEIATLTKFMQIYCNDKHKDMQKRESKIKLSYKSEENIATSEYKLCKECENMLKYAFERLKACPHEIKPRCRNCPKPCYDRVVWKDMAKMMRHSGMKLGLIKIKKIFFGA